MTIDEAIRHAEEVAEENDLAAGTYEILAENNHNAYEKLTAEANSSRCTKFAADHRQLAEWLRELKDLREENKVLMSECDRLIKEKGKLTKSNEAMKGLLLKACDDIYHYVDCFEPNCDECCCSQNDKCQCRWKHEAEALKLIGEDEE